MPANASPRAAAMAVMEDDLAYQYGEDGPGGAIPILEMLVTPLL
jgi:hypothetical protein